MPGGRRISDSELRERLEEHGYNVPPITDTTRAILIKKLTQLDTSNFRSKSRNVEPRRYSGLDYSSAEDEDAPTPIASSTRAGRNNVHHEDTTVTSRATRHTNGGSKPCCNSRKQASLMTHSDEDGSEDEEDDEEEVEEEEEEEEDSEEEEDINVDRVDFAVQTSMLESPSPAGPSQRFRGQKLGNSYNMTPGASPVQNNNYSSNGSGAALASPTYPIMSPYLRKNIKKQHGSLNEALSTLPKSKSSPQTPSSPSSPSTSVTSQASPGKSSRNTSYNTSYSRDNEGPCSYMLVSSLIIAVAAVFFIGLVVQYLSLQPPQPQSVIAVCGGLAGEIPGTSCVPSSQLNDTVQLYKHMRAALPSGDWCSQSQQLAEQDVAQMMLDRPDSQKLWKFIGNLLVLLKQNQSWGIVVEEKDGQIFFSVSTSKSWLCSIYLFLLGIVQFVKDGLWLIFAGVIFLVILVTSFKLISWRNARLQRRKEEVFQLVRQATNLLYQHHQISVREGKAPFVAIKHIRDQLIPLEDRAAKAGLWLEAVDYIEKNESRVRQDVQKIKSEDFRVWQWLPETWSPHDSYASPPSSPMSPMSPPASPPVSSAPPNPWPHVPTTHAINPGWQGCAFPPGKHMTPPVAPPTSCLKVRHMFDVKQQTAMAGNNWVSLVKEEIVKRCSGANILHIAVDTISEEGTVYIKTAGLEDAGKVFNCLHGQWYRGQLVTAKYLRLERYHERFPDSKYSNTPMKPSRNKHTV